MCGDEMVDRAKDGVKESGQRLRKATKSQMGESPLHPTRITFSQLKPKEGLNVDAHQHLDQKIEVLLKKRTADFSREDWASLREQFRLLVLYPGKYVAFRDHFQGEGDDRRLFHREVLHASKSLAVVQKHIATMSEAELQGVQMDFIEVEQAPRRERS